MKRYLAIILAAIILVASTPITTSATHSIGVMQATIYLDGRVFEVWGYDGDPVTPIIRLHDIAYILNGTSGQFSIQTPPDDRWDYWIKRGEPHTPTGLEFQPIPDYRYARFGTIGFFHWVGFDNYPQQTIILGIDGGDYPATSIAVSVLRDVDDTFFNLRDMESLLGFHLQSSNNEHGFYYVIDLEEERVAELPEMSPEFVDILIRISGRWVDILHVFCPTIDEAVIWPQQFSISTHGFAEYNRFRIMPLPSREWTQPEWHPLIKQTLPDGQIELTIGHEAFYGHRIIIDPAADPIEDASYYIHDIRYLMIRWDDNWGEPLWHDVMRYSVEATPRGDIRLRYVADRFAHGLSEIRIYRSTEAGQIGEFIGGAVNPGPYDRILFEFIDSNVEHGKVYFYSIWQVIGTSRPTSRPLDFTPISLQVWQQNDYWQIRVDTSEILTFPETIDNSAADEPLENTANNPTFLRIIFRAILRFLLA